MSIAAHRPLLLRRRLWWTATDAAAVAKRNLYRYIRVPPLLLFSTIQPVMFVLVFTYVFGGAIQVPGVDNYVDYLMAGILAQTVIFSSTQTGVGLAEDMTKGMIDRFRSLPMARSAVLAGRTLSDTARNLFVVCLMLLVGFLVGYRIHTGVIPALGAVALALAFGLAFSWISAFIGCPCATSSRPRRPGSSGCSRWCSPPRPSSRSTACPAGCRPSPGSTRSPSPSTPCGPSPTAGPPPRWCCSRWPGSPPSWWCSSPWPSTATDAPPGR
jgi:hypothetical protein